MGEEAVCLEMPMEEDIAEEISPTKNDLKRGHLCIEEDNVEEELHFNKRQAKEASNDDIRSEISNPVASPVDNASSFRDITSNLAKSTSGDRVGSCYETLSDEENSEYGLSIADSSQWSDDVPSCFVREIPKHLSTTGITKITFKLSKRNEEFCDLPMIKEQTWESASWNVASSTLTEMVFINFPSNVKQLLSTGMLDGARVKYFTISPARELHGIIHSDGYLCGCAACDFSKVIGAYEFERHAGGKTKHPNKHIYLENGRAVYNLFTELKLAPVDVLEEMIRKMAGSALNEEGFQAWKESFQQDNNMAEDDSNHFMDHSFQSFVSYPGSGLSLDESQSSTPCFPENNYFREKICTQDTRYEHKQKAKKLNSHMFGTGCRKKAFEGRKWKRDNDLHRLLFLPNGLPDGTELAYYIKGKKLLHGYKQGSGIVCSCCDREISPSLFEAHAGMAGRRQPYRHIHISSGLALHDIAMSLADGHVITSGDSDDMCSICGDGGDLLLCAGCPQAFHTACLKFQSMPEGTWYCSSCNDGSISCRTATAADPNSKPIVIRRTRVVKAPESEIGGCVFCRSHDFSVGKFDDRTVILCDQCEKEYHVGCLRENEICDLKGIPQDKWFCCNDCSRIHTALQSSASGGPQTIPTLWLDTISRKYREKRIYIDNGDNVEWRMLSGKSRNPEHLPLLSRAAAIFRECFDPIVAKCGRDLIPVMVYGRNISGQEFGGMYCLVLMVNSLVVSAALLRIFGQKVAELPIVATSREYQGRGYFQGLFACVENLLSSLNVENLLLPAAEEAESIWTKKFGFTKVTEQQLQKYQREVQLTIFQGSSMLEKKVPSFSESTSLI
ncbi:Increased DNA methylation 1 [Cardamine amara subsp. amara]|uniref:Increased DNA methylation 1 n=1 Tax=Cardamine amara subsp. amara TaxID=228776 RepID=A0ABD0ZMG5_CARAN